MVQSQQQCRSRNDACMHVRVSDAHPERTPLCEWLITPVAYLAVDRPA